jgi:glycosyltransferase involved in cell wall biosynthesis
MRDDDGIEFSLVVPVYKNEDNIAELIAAISASIMPQAGGRGEVVFVVDGSPDRSRDLLHDLLSKQSWPSQLVSHSRNFGAFSAVRTGLTVTRGRAIAVMTADLQEPPELILEFWQSLARNEADVVFGQRKGRQDGAASELASAIFWKLYRRLVFAEVPDGGLDVFAINRRVRDAVLSISEPNSSLVAQLLWVGFRRKFVPYVRQQRRVGRSAWTFRRKLTYMLDSFVSFSDLPIMLQIWLGLVGLTLSSFAGFVVLVARLAGWITEAGYTPIMLMLAFATSFLLLSQGILGLYLWRAFENTKHRPLAIVSEHISFEGTGRDERT